MEASLDVDMVSAVCPNCRIVLVEANSSSLADLGTAVDTELTFERHCHHPGHAIVAASGDYGYNPAYPDVSSSVIAVGGTTLQRSANPRGWSESAWSGTGGGCSAYAAKPKWQTDAHCPTRLMNDVSAVADPRTGLAVYDTSPSRVGSWSVAPARPPRSSVRPSHSPATRRRSRMRRVCTRAPGGVH